MLDCDKPWKVKWDIKIGDTVVVYTECTGPLCKGKLEQEGIKGSVRSCGHTFTPGTWRDFFRSRHGKYVYYIRPWVQGDDEMIRLNEVRGKADKNVGWLTSYIDRITPEQCEELNKLIERFRKEDSER